MHNNASEMPAAMSSAAAVSVAASVDNGQVQGERTPLVPVQIRFLSPNLVSIGAAGGATSRSRTLSEDWFRSHLSEADAKVLEHSGKMVLLFQILKMAQELGDKVYAASSICRPAG